MKAKQTKAREFSQKAREEIILRDRGQCIFCRINYRMEKADWFGRDIKSIMHYMPRSKGGLGIPENGAVGCQYHHEMLDQGAYGHRPEMLELFKEYLRSKYPEWDKTELLYNKWK